MKTQGLKLDKGNFTVEVKYSEEAIKNKLVKFTVVEGNEIVISADDLVNMLVNQVNSEVLEATFVESDRINVVEVGRQLKCILERDFKKGEIINLNYIHPYPIEFALIEEAWKIAQINKDTKVTELTVEYIEDVKKKIKPEMSNYIRKFYEAFKSINLNKNKMEETKNEEVLADTQAPVEEASVPVESTVESAESAVEESAVPAESVAEAVEPAPQTPDPENV